MRHTAMNRTIQRLATRWLLFAAVASFFPGQLNAQRAPLIHIVEPEVWRDGLPAVIPAGRTVKIAGLASHPSGIQQVLINGKVAFLKAVPDFPDSFDFEAVLTADTADIEVVITVLPRESEPFERRYSIRPPQLPGTPVAPQSERASAVEIAAPQADPPPANLAPSPWRGFTLRGAGWAGLVAAGLILTRGSEEELTESCRPVGAGQDCFRITEVTHPRRNLGLAIAGAALVGVVTDAILTSRRARTPAQRESLGLRILPPAIEWDTDQVRLGLIRLNH